MCTPRRPLSQAKGLARSIWAAVKHPQPGEHGFRRGCAHKSKTKRKPRPHIRHESKKGRIKLTW